MKGSWLTCVVALAGVCVTLPAQTVSPTLFGDTRYLLPPGQASPVPPPPDPGYRPTPQQHPLPEARFVEEAGFAVATHSVFQVRLGPSLAGLDAVAIVTPEGKTLRGVPVALSLMDARTGRNALIAGIKPGHRRVVEGNRVTYVDCWDEVRADVVYVLSRSRIAQHVIIRGPLPDVAQLGLDPKTTRLQVWTELAPSEEPARQTALLKRVPQGLDFMDERLGLGMAEMVPGRAFMMRRGQEEARGVSSPVGKRYMKYGQPGMAGERAFLVEEVEWEPLVLELEKALPKAEPLRRQGARLGPEAGKPAASVLVAKGDAPGYAFPRREGAHARVEVRPGLAGQGASQLALVVDWELLYTGEVDQDYDGLPDSWEYLWFGSLAAQGANGDPDGDGLFNYEELFYGTHPMDADTDRDGHGDFLDWFPLISSNLSLTVWFNEPTNVFTNAIIGSWLWVGASTNPPYPVSGLANVIPLHDGAAHTGFTNHPSPLLLASNDVLFAFVYLPPNNPPTQLALHWLPNDGSGWRGVYWGENALGCTNAVLASSNLPVRGQWVMLAAQAGQMGLGGKTIVGMRVMAYDGGVMWDYSGSWWNGNLDRDGDGLPDWRERQLGTDPYYPDTDYDGVSDGQELAEGTNPLHAASVAPRRLGYWRFDTSSFVGEQGQVPTWRSPTLTAVPSWSSNAVNMTRELFSGLRYREYETNGQANINVRNGTVRLWFKPHWSSTNVGGAGPGTWSRLIELGYYLTPPTGHWCLHFTPEGHEIRFGSISTNPNVYTRLAAPISWVSNQWHQVVLTYSPTNTALYVDGQLVQSTGGIQAYPRAELRALGLWVGTEIYGSWLHGQMEELETFNYPLSAAAIWQDFGALDIDGDGLSNAQELSLGTDWRNPDTDGDGVDDGVEYLQGRNPLVAGTVNDTNGVVNLQVFTPLQ